MARAIGPGALGPVPGWKITPIIKCIWIMFLFTEGPKAGLLTRQNAGGIPSTASRDEKKVQITIKQERLNLLYVLCT